MARPSAAQRQARIPADCVSSGRAEPCPAPSEPARSPSVTTRYDPLLTIDEVSHWLGVPKGTLYQWRSRNQGPRAIKVGGALRYRRSEVDAFLDRQTDSRSAW
jgi:excisionase family DNA binding protein